LKYRISPFKHRTIRAWLRALIWLVVSLHLVASTPVHAQTQGPVKITLDDAIQFALQHNHNLLAAQTAIPQDEALETQANLRPNPDIFGDLEYLPLFAPSMWTGSYLDNSVEADLGLSYLCERGKKRQHRLQAAKDVTAQARSLVADNERTLTFNVAAQFFNVQLAESTLDLATKDVEQSTSVNSNSSLAV
jgi:outer membrane protein, heavy metal efflux system